jgi:hypothetical protein
VDEQLATLQALGFTLPSPAYIAGALVFGLIGFAAWRFGRKQERPVTKWIGVALMLYPYLVSNTVWMFVVGAALCAGLWYDRVR